MSYYRYLSRYSPGFLQKYQTETYAHMQRQTQFADIVQMNATTSLTIDEDLTLRYRVPYSIANLLGLACLFYWYMSHANMFSANTIRNRLASYHNYKMWSRLEVVAHKSSCESGHEVEQAMQERWLRNYNITREQLDSLIERCSQGEELTDVLNSMGLQWDGNSRTMVPLE
jgi:hypothetical protein